MNELELTLDALVREAPVERLDWDDVVARARRPRRRRMMAFALAAALTATVVVTPAFGIGSRLLDLFTGAPVGSDRLSAEEVHDIGAMASGVSPRIPASQEEDLARFGATSLRQIAVRDGRAYFVANLRGGGLCVSIGQVGDARVLGSISCSPNFPSSARPILDQSIFQGPVEQPRITRLEGFADDSVGSVGIVTASGALTAVTPVENNVYSRSEGLPTEPVSEIVALDANGRRVYSACFVRTGCP